jgi:hypothetical protein
MIMEKTVSAVSAVHIVDCSEEYYENWPPPPPGITPQGEEPAMPPQPQTVDH